jgi:hypothetical protein
VDELKLSWMHPIIVVHAVLDEQNSMDALRMDVYCGKGGASNDEAQRRKELQG